MEKTGAIARLTSYALDRTASDFDREALLDLVDAIKREAMEERTAAYNAGYDAGFASADDWAAQHEDAMAEHGWVRLPLDANGDVLHIGELVDEELPFGGYAPPAPIDTMELSRDASGYRWMVKLDAENRALINPKLLRHHHAPTVEDVLREFTDEVWDRCCEGATASDSGIDELVAEYAAKLALRGDE